MRTSIGYGKRGIGVYRTAARPLEGVRTIPESGFAGRPKGLFACEVDVEVFGDSVLPAYTEGDNAQVVPTDTMKNVVLEQALAFRGATLERFLYDCGRAFLGTYPQMQALRMSGRELPFRAAPVPTETGRFGGSDVLFARQRDDHAVATLDLLRTVEGGVALTDHRCGQVGLQLIKTTGSSFTRFARDEHTTLPEQVDRPLFIYLDVYWRYRDANDLLDEQHAGYVAAEQVRDLVGVVFHRFVSKSIQHLVHEMGQRLLERFEQIVEVSFVAQNRLWDTAGVSASDEQVKVYTDPRPPYGEITLTLRR
ncbi:MAG TPA: urate oxidase [Chloroflexota bacterium]|nr:urate oxidase [Chloroflexota bacterium]